MGRKKDWLLTLIFLGGLMFVASTGSVGLMHYLAKTDCESDGGKFVDEGLTCKKEKK